MQELDNIWSLVLKELSNTYPAISMSIWFDDLTLTSLTDETCTLQVEAGFKKDILETFVATNEGSVWSETRRFDLDSQR